MKDAAGELLFNIGQGILMVMAAVLYVMLCVLLWSWMFVPMPSWIPAYIMANLIFIAGALPFGVILPSLGLWLKYK